jgi:hypothetical protein
MLGLLIPSFLTLSLSKGEERSMLTEPAFPGSGTTCRLDRPPANQSQLKEVIYVKLNSKPPNTFTFFKQHFEIINPT